MTDQTLSGAGGYDWLEVWRRMYDAERRQAEMATDPNFERQADMWALQATRFAKASRRAPQPDGFMQLLLPRLRSTDTVLDIGSGSGRYVPLLARTVAQVLALEPSPAMRAQLEQRISEEQLTNVTIIADPWPMGDPPRVDVAISAHVVYGVREIGPFLQAMDAVARRACYLYLGMRHPAAVLSPFWERFHGMARLPLPCALEAVNALHQIGIPASMEMVPVTNRLRFADADEALHDIRLRLRFAPDQRRDAALVAAIGEMLEPEADGSLAPPRQPRHAAVIWWQPATSQPDCT